MESGIFVIVGLGNIGFPLLRMLPREFKLVVIDRSAETLAAARQLRGETLTAVEGDATSRLVLERAGVAEADAVILTTSSEAVNVEVARLLKAHYQVPRVISVGVTQKGIEDLEALGVEVEGIFAVSATGLHNRLEQKAKTVHGIGLGKNEIIEVEVHPNSRLAGKQLAALNPKRWRVGIVYRDGAIIIPGGDTELRARDKVVILGEPKVLKTVTDMLTFRFTLFPLEYGDTLLAWCDGAAESLGELDYLFGALPFERATVIHEPAAGIGERLRELADRHSLKDFTLLPAPARLLQPAAQRVLIEQGRRAGLVVLPKAAFRAGRWPGGGRRKRLLTVLTAELGCPLLLAAGTFPYRQAAVPAVDELGLQHALETALEVAPTFGYGVAALFAGLSPYIASAEDGEVHEVMKKTVSDLGLIYRLSVRSIELKGNPVTAIVAGLGERDLLVADICSWRAGGAFASLWQPDVAWQIVRRAAPTTLLVPPTESIS